MFRSNFTVVRLSEDRKRLSLTGTSEAVEEIQEIRLAYAAAPDDLTPLSPGTDALPTKRQHELVEPGPIREPWTVTIDLAKEFEAADTLVIAASALRLRTREDGGHEHAVDTWLGYIPLKGGLGALGTGTDAPKVAFPGTVPPDADG